MKKEDFLKILKSLREIEKFTNKLNEAQLEFFNTDCYDSMWRSYRILFSLIYGSIGYDTIEWYLFDLPEYKVKYPNETYLEEDGKAIELDSDEDLFDYIERHKEEWLKIDLEDGKTED